MRIINPIRYKLLYNYTFFVNKNIMKILKNYSSFEWLDSGRKRG